MCEEYGITAGAKSAKKAQLLLPSFCTRLFDCLAMCGSKLVLRVREDGSSEDKWHIRTLPECVCGGCCGCRCCECKCKCGKCCGDCCQVRTIAC